jgi:hypothetical protein
MKHRSCILLITVLIMGLLTEADFDGDNIK